MATSDFFADTYAAAREKFLTAAGAARCDVSSYRLPNHVGPRDEELTIDVGKLGPAEPEALLVLISGTHGVEGFCGSGCQVGFLTDRLYEALPVNCGALLVHALNPYGFAWLRRVNEDNIDLNRNFYDFSKDLPSCSAYEELHDWLVPLEWEGEHRQRADDELRKYIAANGMRAFQGAITSGQRTDPRAYSTAERLKAGRTTRFVKFARNTCPQLPKWWLYWTSIQDWALPHTANLYSSATKPNSIALSAGMDRKSRSLIRETPSQRWSAVMCPMRSALRRIKQKSCTLLSNMEPSRFGRF